MGSRLLGTSGADERRGCVEGAVFCSVELRKYRHFLPMRAALSIMQKNDIDAFLLLPCLPLEILQRVLLNGVSKARGAARDFSDNM